MFGCIVTKKYKNPKKIMSAARHNLRIHKSRNVLAERSKYNTVIGSRAIQTALDKAIDDYKQEGGKTIRKDAVLIIESVLYVGKQYFKEAKTYNEYKEREELWIKHCVKYVNQEFGGKPVIDENGKEELLYKNILNVSVHRDEGEIFYLPKLDSSGKTILDNNGQTKMYPVTCPHIHVLATPIRYNDKGTPSFNCASWTNNTKYENKLGELQDRYVESMPKGYGIVRGVKKSITKTKYDKEISQFYTEINAPDLTQENAVSKAVYLNKVLEKFAPVMKNLEYIADLTEVKQQYEDYISIVKQIVADNNPNMSDEEINDYLKNKIEENKTKDVREVRKIAYKDNPYLSKDEAEIKRDKKKKQQQYTVLNNQNEVTSKNEQNIIKQEEQIKIKDVSKDKHTDNHNDFER